MQEYILGRYDNALQKDVVREPNAELPKIPLKKVDDEILPYFEVFMSEGKCLIKFAEEHVNT